MPAGLPVSVITHGRAGWIHEEFGLDQAELDQAERVWQRYRLDLAATYPGSRFLVAARSGHMIAIEEPDLITAEIQTMIAKIAVYATGGNRCRHACGTSTG